MHVHVHMHIHIHVHVHRQNARLHAYHAMHTQIMFKPSAQSLRADAQDVCSHKCEVCRLAGLSLLNQTQGVCVAHALST
jgi:hypothetical protein